MAPVDRHAIGVHRGVIISDLHMPFHDARAVAVALALIADIQPEIIVLNGDIADFYSISRFLKDPSRESSLQQEIDELRTFLEVLRSICPEARIIFVEGNHEARLRKYVLGNAPKVASLRNLSMPQLLGTDGLDIEYVPGIGDTAYVAWGEVQIGHHAVCRSDSAYTAKALVERNARTVVQGHTHRLGQYYKTYSSVGMVMGAEGGCLCDLNPEYVSDPNWQHGLTVVTKRIDTPRFHVQSVPIVGYEAMFNDTLYTA